MCPQERDRNQTQKIAKRLRILIRQSLVMYNLPVDASAVELLIMIAAHESGLFKYVQQVNGPALGLFQMEPATYKEVREYMNRSSKRFEAIKGSSPERMVIDVRYAVGMARIFLMRFPEALPCATDPQGMARYAKKYWNTEAGKATVSDYRDAYLKCLEAK